MKLALIFSLVASVAVNLYIYNLGYKHGVNATNASFDCPPATAGEIAKIKYPDGTIKCPDYAKRISQVKKGK